MEKRLILAVLLMGAVIMLTNVLFPPPEPTAPGAPADSTAAAPASAPAPTASAALPQPVAPTRADTVVVSSPLYRYAFSTRGAALVRAELLEYPSYTESGQPVQLVPRGATEFLAHQLVVGGDTVELRSLPFQPSARSLTVDAGTGEQTLRFTYAQPDGFGAEIVYTFRPDGYLVGVRGRVLGLGGRPAVLLTRLGPGLAPHEAYDHHSEQQLAVVTREPGEITRIGLAKLEGAQAVERPLTWAGIKDKYFLAAIIAGDQRPLAGVSLRDLPDARLRYPREEKVVPVPRAELITRLPVSAQGEFAFDAYLGPQDYRILSGLGHDLENVTQYAYRWLEPIIRPVAAVILWVLQALHSTLGLAYGWVLVVFGVLMRILLWPLNAKAMRAQMKNMGVQPLMQEIREKYKNDPQKQQEELLKLYKEHGFNPLAGCMPMLIPFPVLITLFFVFQNTIAFRGAEFLWLPDLSLRDPLYLLPLVLIVSAFGLQWVSVHMSGMEQNPQMKMMLYFMPIMMGIIFVSLPAGLNLYYATTQVASIPQQILIAKERRRAQEQLKASGGKLTPGSMGERKPKPRAKGR